MNFGESMSTPFQSTGSRAADQGNVADRPPDPPLRVVAEDHEPPETRDIPREWWENAIRLAYWAEKLRNRQDAYGQYRDLKDRRDPTLKAITVKGADQLQSVTWTSIVENHFAGPLSPAGSKTVVIGFHSTRVDAEGNCWSRWGAYDIDRHDESGDPAATWAYAKLLRDRLVALGFHVILEDSNGEGGYHVIVLFNEPVPTHQVYQFLRSLIADWKESGLDKEPETFPKQASIPIGGFGNWMRLPGWHHTSDHWSRIWDADSESWLDGRDAAQALIDTPSNSPDLIPQECRETPKPEPLKQIRWGDQGSLNGESEIARQALQVTSHDVNDYADWIEVGMAINSKFPGPDGLSLWDDWSSQSPKYQDGNCYRKWLTFTPNGGVTFGTLLYRAAENGFDPKSAWRAQNPKGRGSRGGATTNENGAKSVSPPPSVPGRTNEAPDDPHRLARLYRDEYCAYQGERTIHFWNSGYPKWDCQFGKYIDVPESEITAELTGSTKIEFDRLNREEAEICAKQNPPADPPLTRKVGKRLIGDVRLALNSFTLLPSTVNAPSWLDADPPFPAHETIATPNAVVHLPSFIAGKECTIPPTPKFFSFNALDYPFDRDAPRPVAWLNFLAQVFLGDNPSIEAIQEWFGYLLTPDTSLQKILMLIGPKRCGKGTIVRVGTALIGASNVANPTLGSLATQFGMECLLGKTAAFITDARLSGRTDIATVVERLLSISGEDNQTVDRKHRPSVTTNLLTRFTLVSNELPRMRDSSGALSGRMLILPMTQSFYGREDPALTVKLLRELPGILLWAIKGWARLRERGHFLQPENGLEMTQQMDDLASPIGAFLRECCVVGSHHEVPVDRLFNRWKTWCQSEGKDHVGDKTTFGRDLRTVIPTLTNPQRRVPDSETNERHRIYVGVTLRPEHAANPQGGGAAPVTDDTVDAFLSMILSNGRHEPAESIFEQGKAKGITKDQLFKAMKRIGVKARNDTASDGYVWYMPPETTQQF